MNLTKRDIGFIGLILAVAAMLFAISGEKKTKPVPDDSHHQLIYRTAYRNAPLSDASMIKRLFFRPDKRNAEVCCEQCHNNRNVPLPPNHPSKNRCLFCHELQPLKK